MTARDLTAGMLSEIAAARLSPILLYEGEFVSGTIRYWTGYGNISWNGYTWTGLGAILSISAIEETSQVKASGVNVKLSGISSSIIGTALSECRLGKVGRIYFGCLDSSGNVVADPYLAFSGRLDVPTIIAEGETCTVSVTYESKLIDLQRAVERRYTDEDQKVDYPTDRGFEFVAALQEKEVTWGGKKQNGLIQDVAKNEAHAQVRAEHQKRMGTQVGNGRGTTWQGGVTVNTQIR